MAVVHSAAEFPNFTDGEVYIVVSTSKIYKLHLQVLRQKSALFRDLLEFTPATKLNAAARRAECAAWRFHYFVPPHNPDQSQFIPIVSLATFVFVAAY